MHQEEWENDVPCVGKTTPFPNLAKAKSRASGGPFLVRTNASRESSHSTSNFALVGGLQNSPLNERRTISILR